MKTKVSLDSSVKWLFLCGWLALFIGGVTHYSGSWFAYTLFSLVFLAMLASGFYRQIGYGYLFLVVMLWLGFWVKLTAHVILKYPFVEATGSFIGGGPQWDEVLHVATLASLGVMLGGLLYRYMRLTRHTEVAPIVPPWYANKRKIIWTLLIITAIGLLWLNFKYQVHLIGLAPQTILMWPLNALIAWGLNIGLATGVGVLLWWDIALKKNIVITTCAMIGEAAFSSVSILSRSVYVFHAIPQLFAIHRLRHELKGWTRVKTVGVIFLFMLAMLVSIAGTTTLRNFYYQSGAYMSTALANAIEQNQVLIAHKNRLLAKLKNATPAEKLQLEGELTQTLVEQKNIQRNIAKEKAKILYAMNSKATQAILLTNEFEYQITNGALNVILQLSVDRWVGLEGLMAVQAYPKKGMSLFTHALTGKPQIGKTDIYQTISNSIYVKEDGTKFKFATLPGPAAFLYFSNSGLVVIVGMIALSLFLLLSEFFIMKLTGNPILCSLYGAAIASNVAQFGGYPRQNIPYYLMLISGILAIWAVQSEFCTKLFIKLRLHKEIRG